MGIPNTLERGRKAFRQQQWADAYTLLSSADHAHQIEPEDIRRLAAAAYLTGKVSESPEIWARAHHEYLENDKKRQAANCAFWLGIILFNQGEKVQGSGWMARAARLISDLPQKCVEEGLLLIPKALQHLGEGKPERAYHYFSKAGEIGEQFDNQDLITLSRLGQGQALIYQKKINKGTTLLDEAMIAVISEEISPIVAGLVYCAVIETCQKIYDLQRAQEWTAALSRWCDSQPDLVPYRGQCLVRRAEIMQLHGEWTEAMDEVHRACTLLSESTGEPAAGEAFYLQAELHRLQGDFTEAEKNYRHASKWGRKPQPGLALLRMAQGEADTAEAAIRQAEEEQKNPMVRSKILPAYIDIMLAVDDIKSAQAGAADLSEIAGEFQAPFLQAMAIRAEGNIILKKGEPQKALDKLLDGWSALKKIGASYESAKTRMLIGLAYQKLGDKDSAEIELEAARGTFQQLGATYDLSKMDSFVRHTSSGDHTHGLTSRELQVLRLVATGKTNREIGTELYISERTVDRHVSNILAKLNVPSRAAATAYAYEHEMI
ncbi:transcriptional regulator, LuxR family [Fodinibius roseus]|uniref:Transcriptional regulator, LuxR family n=1 Tax=Fodinibius roseus TaxID=1194090 RepID=A0A1M4SMI1_9BACT|nr:helix-turn-helix transcriptional regulator [Fodinibius roseus]SHE33368.1 transcriptional regulator, LuxR family [Fodinibius roseus]